jgi:hypothetical protein
MASQKILPWDGRIGVGQTSALVYDLNGALVGNIDPWTNLTPDEVIRLLVRDQRLGRPSPEYEYVLRLKRTGDVLVPGVPIRDQKQKLKPKDVLQVGVKLQTLSATGERLFFEINQIVLRLEGQESLKKEISDLRRSVEKLHSEGTKLSARVLFPTQDELDVRLVKLDAITSLEQHRTDESRWYSVFWAFVGATLGVVVNWATAETIQFSKPSIILILVFALIGLLTWREAQRFERRAETAKQSILNVRWTTRADNTSNQIENVTTNSTDGQLPSQWNHQG